MPFRQSEVIAVKNFSPDWDTHNSGQELLLFMGNRDTLCRLPKCSLPGECFSSVSTWKSLRGARKWATTEMYLLPEVGEVEDFVGCVVWRYEAESWRSRSQMIACSMAWVESLSLPGLWGNSLSWALLHERWFQVSLQSCLVTCCEFLNYPLQTGQEHLCLYLLLHSKEFCLWVSW